MKYLYTEFKLDENNNFIIVANHKHKPDFNSCTSSNRMNKETDEWKSNHETIKIFDSKNEALILKNALKELGNEFPSENNIDLRKGVELDCVSIRKIGHRDDLNGEYYAFFKNEKHELYTDILEIIFVKLGGNERNPEVTEDIINLLIENNYLKK